MKTHDYACSIQASVSAEEAYDKIARVSEWWAKNFKGTARNLGDTFTVRFGETFVDFRISEAIPDSKIVWQVANCHLPWLKDKTEWSLGASTHRQEVGLCRYRTAARWKGPCNSLG